MLRITLHRSPCLAAGFVAVHAVAVVTVLPLDIPLAVKIGIAALILASLSWSACRYALLGLPGSIVALEIRDHKTATLQTRDGQLLEAQILGTTYVTPALTVINARPASKRFAKHVLLMADNVDPEAFRQLRVLLRWRYEAGPEKSQIA